MTKVSDRLHEPLANLAASSAAAASDLFRVKQGSSAESKMTLTKLLTLISSDLGTMVADDITVSSMTITGLTAALSAGTFSTTGATSGALGAVTSGDGNCIGFATVGQIEYLITTVLNLKTNMDKLIS